MDGIKAYVDRLETLLSEIDGLREDVRAIYEEAGQAGIIVKALRKLIAKRRRKPDPETDAKVEQYEMVAELDLRIKVGEIKSWRRQVSFRLPRLGVKKCSLIVDFVVTLPDGSERVEEVKGFASPEWRVKWAWFETDYPDVEKAVIW